MMSDLATNHALQYMTDAHATAARVSANKPPINTMLNPPALFRRGEAYKDAFSSLLASHRQLVTPEEYANLCGEYKEILADRDDLLTKGYSIKYLRLYMAYKDRCKLAARSLMVTSEQLRLDFMQTEANSLSLPVTYGTSVSAITGTALQRREDYVPSEATEGDFPPDYVDALEAGGIRSFSAPGNLDSGVLQVMSSTDADSMQRGEPSAEVRPMHSRAQSADGKAPV